MGAARPPEGGAPGRAPAGRTDPLRDVAGRALSGSYEVLNRVQTIGFWPTYLARRLGEGGAPVLLSLMPRKGLGAARVSELVRGLEAAAGLVHPHAVPVVEHGMEDSFLWFVTRRETWRPISSIIKGGGSFADEELIRLAREAARFLVLLHRQEHPHGALCPANFLLDRRERLRIANTGADGPILAHRVARGLPLGIVGEYAAPEVLAGEKATPRSDQYSLARVLRACAGDACPGVVTAILGRATADLPDQRYAHVMDFLDAYLDAWSIADGPASAPAPRPRSRPRPPAPRVLVPSFDLDDDVPDDPRPSAFRGTFVLLLGAGLGAVLTGAAAISGSADRPLLAALQQGGERVVQAAAAALSGRSSGPERLGDAEGGPEAWEEWEWRDPRDTVRTATLPSPSGEPGVRRSSAQPPRSSEPPARASTSETTTTAPPPRTRPTPRRTIDSEPRQGLPARSPTTTTQARTLTQAAPETPAARPERPTLPGHVWVNAFPWGTVYIDGRRIGNTPLVGIALDPGSHDLRVEREGFEPYEGSIRVTSGSELYRTDIVLRKRPGS